MYRIDMHLPARVVVDPNGASRLDPDLIVARLSEADRKVSPGEFVLAVEPENDGPDLVGSAWVSHVDEDHGLLYLHVDWTSFSEDPSQSVDFVELLPHFEARVRVRSRYRPLSGIGIDNAAARMALVSP